MTRSTRAALALTGLLLFAWAVSFYARNLRGVGPAIEPPPGDITKIINTTGMPLKLTPGFSISIFAKDLPGARVMAGDSLGNMWVSQTSEGTISLLEIQDGEVRSRSVVFRNLRKPHGLAFDPQDPFALYFAEEHGISRVRVYAEGEPEEIAELPYGNGHFTRTLGFGPDGRLYASVGSSCNVCDETDDRRAKIFSMNRDGSDFREHARGLRNAVFFTWSYVDGSMWATEMGRDLLGDDLPPEEINVIEAGKNYGWPVCYGKNVHDTDFDGKKSLPAGRQACMEPFETPSAVDLPAHSAPLGLAFVPEEGWPEEYWYDLLVAYHGSWNRTVPTGYKVVRVPLDAQGRQTGPIEDFITGWLTPEGALGRPVDIITRPGGLMYLTDDKAGVVYRITYGSDAGGGGIGNEVEKQDLIRLSAPRPNEVVASPLLILGAARGGPGSSRRRSRSASSTAKGGNSRSSRRRRRESG